MCLQVQLNVQAKTAATQEWKKMEIITAGRIVCSNDLWRCFGRALQAENQVLLVAQVKSS
jgi:hypothetical protein